MGFVKLGNKKYNYAIIGVNNIRLQVIHPIVMICRFYHNSLK
jgi:hypothetical protein